jgi:hypothetical protein
MGNIKKPIIESYLQLKEEWQSTPRGLGGLTAIKGFDFQFLLTIKKVIDSLPSGRIVTSESLSDISEFDTESILITQSKYCLSSAAVIHALDELWDIHCLITEEFTDLKSCTQYIILGQNQELKNISVTIENWKKKKKGNDEVEFFTRKISTNIYSNPYEEIIQTLIEDYSVTDPWNKVSAWLGGLYHSLPKHSIDQACEAIKNDLTAYQNKKKNTLQRNIFHLWKESDVPPETIEQISDPKKACIVGESPKKLHLTQGRFSNRKIYHDIYKSYLTWVNSTNYQYGSKLPVFWISGRSGAGKSVALLHLLSMIKSGSRETIVVSLGDKPSSLREFFPYLDEVCTKHKQCLLSFDDPYIYERQEEFDHNISLLSVLAERLAERGLEESIPYVVCCGPDEQLEWCEESLGDYIAIEKYRLKNETEEDIEEVKEWFEARTGLTIDKGGDASEKLLVQSMFEWSNNKTLKDFARNFKKRLNDKRWGNQEVSLFELISNVLAVNRLYAPFPLQMLNELKDSDPNLAKAIYQLENEDGHIKLINDAEGLKLTHPHLADLLYREWYGRGSETGFRKSHLSKWFSFVEDSSDKPKYSLMPLWRVAKLSNPLLAYEYEAIPRIDLIRDDLKYILPNIYVNHLALDRPLSYLPVWINLDNNLNLKLNPSPLDVIGDNLVVENIDNEGFRLACHKVIEFYDDANEITKENIHKVITSCKEWHEWDRIVFDFVKRLGVGKVEPVIIGLVENNPEHSCATRITNYLVRDIIEPNENARIVIERWLMSCDMDASSWVANYTDYSNVYPLSKDLIDKAKTFLNTRKDNKSWSYIWEAVWSTESGNPELDYLARSWLVLKLGKDGGWSFVWEELAKNKPRDQELIDLAYRFMDNKNTPKSTRCVLGILLEQDDDKNRVKKFANEWLVNTPIWHREWIYFWTPFVINFKTDNASIELGMDWLCYAPIDHPAWVDTRDRVLRVFKPTEELQKKSIIWLQSTCPNEESWPYIWTSTSDNDSGNNSTISLGLEWLSAVDMNHRGWNMVWEKIWDRQSHTEELRAIGKTWLSGVDSNHACWQFIWKRLVNDSLDDFELIKVAQDWLTRVDSSHHSWGNVWGKLWELSEDQSELRKIAEDWLENAPKTHKSKRFVKSKIAKPVTIDDKFSALKEKWGSK